MGSARFRRKKTAFLLAFCFTHFLDRDPLGRAWFSGPFSAGARPLRGDPASQVAKCPSAPSGALVGALGHLLRRATRRGLRPLLVASFATSCQVFPSLPCLFSCVAFLLVSPAFSFRPADHAWPDLTSWMARPTMGPAMDPTMDSEHG